MKNKHDSTAVSSEPRNGKVDTEFVARLQHELEMISEEQAFLWEMKQQNMQHSIKEQALFQELQNQMVALNKVVKEPAYGLYDFTTFHKTKPYLDSKGILRHRKEGDEDSELGNTVYAYISKQKATLCTGIDGLVYYVQTVNKDGAVQLVRNPVWNEMNTNLDGSIVVQFEQGFLSANKNGNFQLSKNASNLGHFWLQDHMLPTVLKLEELMADIDYRFSFPWSVVRTGSRIVIYGRGIVGKNYLHQLARVSYCSLVAICDKNPEEIGILEAPVITVQELYRMKTDMYDMILIATEKKKTAMDIREELELAGIPADKIKWADPIRERREELHTTGNRLFANESNDSVLSSPSTDVIKIQENNAEKLRKSEVLISELTAALDNEKKAHSTDSGLLLKFSKYFTARIDIKFIPKTGQGDFRLLSVSDNKAQVKKPAWLQKDGMGYQIETYAGKIEIVVKATAAGQIDLNLRGLDIRNPADKTKRIPYWVDYVSLKISGKEILGKLTPTWHDKSHRFNVDVRANQEVKVQIEWIPHRSDS